MPTIKKKGYNSRDLREVSDNPEWTKEDFAKAKPFAEALWVSLRLTGAVIDKYKAGGAGWQSRIDEDLRRINKIK